jgi:hypothetical protein
VKQAPVSALQRFQEAVGTVGYKQMAADKKLEMMAEMGMVNSLLTYVNSLLTYVNSLLTYVNSLLTYVNSLLTDERRRVQAA